MPCDLCRNLPLRTVRQLNADIEAGDLSYEQVAQNYGATAVLIEAHINSCVMSARSGYSMLTQLLDSINRAATERKRKYDDTEDEIAMDHYIALIREARSTVMAMDKLKPSEELVRSIIQQILTPFVNQCTVIAVDECSRLRDDARSFLEPSLYPRLDQSVKALLRRIAVRLKKDTADLVPRLRKLLNVQLPTDEPVADDPGADDEKDVAPAPPPVN